MKSEVYVLMTADLITHEYVTSAVADRLKIVPDITHMTIVGHVRAFNSVDPMECPWCGEINCFQVLGSISVMVDPESGQWEIDAIDCDDSSFECRCCGEICEYSDDDEDY